jgi:hypothetical protein
LNVPNEDKAITLDEIKQALLAINYDTVPVKAIERLTNVLLQNKVTDVLIPADLKTTCFIGDMNFIDAIRVGNANIAKYQKPSEFLNAAEEYQKIKNTVFEFKKYRDEQIDYMLHAGGHELSETNREIVRQIVLRAQKLQKDDRCEADVKFAMAKSKTLVKAETILPKEEEAKARVRQRQAKARVRKQQYRASTVRRTSRAPIDLPLRCRKVRAL